MAVPTDPAVIQKMMDDGDVARARVTTVNGLLTAAGQNAVAEQATHAAAIAAEQAKTGAQIAQVSDLAAKLGAATKQIVTLQADAATATTTIAAHVATIKTQGDQLATATKRVADLEAEGLLPSVVAARKATAVAGLQKRHADAQAAEMKAKSDQADAAAKLEALGISAVVPIAVLPPVLVAPLAT